MRRSPSPANRDGDPRIYLEAVAFEKSEATADTPAVSARAKAFDWAAKLRAHYPSSRVLVGASMEKDREAIDLGADLAGRAETTVALPLLRCLLADGRVAHFAPPEQGPDVLTEQVAAARVTGSATGTMALVNGPPSHALAGDAVGALLARAGSAGCAADLLSQRSE